MTRRSTSLWVPVVSVFCAHASKCFFLLQEWLASSFPFWQSLTPCHKPCDYGLAFVSFLYFRWRCVSSHRKTRMIQSTSIATETAKSEVAHSDLIRAALTVQVCSMGRHRTSRASRVHSPQTQNLYGQVQRSCCIGRTTDMYLNAACTISRMYIWACKCSCRVFRVWTGQA